MFDSQSVQLILSLKSDLLAGSGEGFGSIIDTDIVYDDYGIPFIPSKRMKGLLSDGLMEFMEFPFFSNPDNEIKLQSLLKKKNELFGTSGDQEGAIDLPDLYPEEYQDMRNAIGFLIQEGKISKQEVIGLWTSLRRQTAIDQNTGIQKDHSLRTSRLLKQKPFGDPIVFKGTFQVSQPDSEQQFVLQIAADNFRHMGHKRTRGSGNVEISIFDKNHNDFEKYKNKLVDFLTNSFNQKGKEEPIKEERNKEADSIENPKSGNNKGELTLKLTLLQPLIIGTSNAESTLTESESIIPGYTIWGALASHFIKTNKIFDKPENDPLFKRLFLSEAVTYGAAIPSVTESHSTILPFNYHQVIKEKTKGINIWIKTDAEQKALGKTKSIGNFGKVDDTGITPLKVTHEIRPHHQRNRETRSPEKGIFFSYEGIRKGHQFITEITGSAADINSLERVIPPYLKLGKSRSSEYGLVKVEIINNKTIKETQSNSEDNIEVDSFYLILQSDTLLRNEFGSSTAESKYLTELLISNGLKLKLVKAIIQKGETETYSYFWKSRRSAEILLKAGSVFEFSIEEKTSFSKLEKDIFTKFPDGIGDLIHKGFGRFSLEQISKTPDYNLSENIPIKIEKPLNLKSPTTKIIETWLYDQVRNKIETKAITDANETDLARPHKMSRSFPKKWERILLSINNLQEGTDELNRISELLLTKNNMKRKIGDIEFKVLFIDLMKDRFDETTKTKFLNYEMVMPFNGGNKIEFTPYQKNELFILYVKTYCWVLGKKLKTEKLEDENEIRG